MKQENMVSIISETYNTLNSNCMNWNSKETITKHLQLYYLHHLVVVHHYLVSVGIRHRRLT